MYSESMLAKGVYDALIGAAPLMALVTGVYDHVPQETAKPFVKYDISSREWGADDIDGAEATITVHTWTGGRGTKLLKQIQDATKNALHNAAVSVTGSNVVVCYWESHTSALEPDGITRHGVSIFKMILSGV